ncbi:carboxypeptidase-like regulatory domain-containing protein [Tamlana sp. 2201CG12-4]|uniref:carboxypeptidase-like regulatory domain-containing protein n=1 Tax=Tamlana sp. 2201CG12-4 TaxID=3112582 RepID=UPI002DBDE322|nr:carboxypeptidase-like regulatory domain-containing protein [Tamlana sp. 2201CG12-4]MEC3905913.1 carboxypeptidase-like regulatory domain-containing protein [Tamlana sp. 2201CG12-4]
MKYIVFIVFLLVTATSGFAQNSGSLSGNLFDVESNNQPLAFASVKIKETNAEVLSDENGVFKFENLAEGTYTLVYSFIGYETQETQVSITSNELTTVKLYLAASTISLDDLVMAIASNETKKTSSDN